MFLITFQIIPQKLSLFFITCILSYFRWLCNPNIDVRTRKWAVEGLAYLTMDADVKDDFVEDEPALQAMFELTKVSEDCVWSEGTRVNTVNWGARGSEKKKSN